MSKFFAPVLVCSLALILGHPGRSDPPSPKDGKATENKPSRTDLYGDPLPPGAIARLGTVRFRHEGRWFGTAFLDGGKILATASSWGLRFWDTASGRLLREIKGDFDSPPVPSADGKWLAMRENDSLSIREVPSGRLIRRWDPAGVKPGSGNPFAFSTDGKMLVEGGYETLRLWDTATGKEIRHFDAQNFHVSAAVFTNQGRSLVTAGMVFIGRGNRKGVICHWDLATGKLLQKTPIDILPIGALRISHDGQLVAVASWPAEAVRLLDAQTGKELRQLQGEKTGARRLAFSPDDRLLATSWFEQGDESAIISIWNPATGKLVHRFSIPLRVADDIQFAPNSRTLLTKNDWVVKLWDTNTGKSLLDWPAHEGSITTLEYLPDSRALISGSYDQTTRIWDAATGQQRRLLPFFGYDSRLLPGGRAILSNALPGAITVRDIETGKVLRRFAFDEQPENSASLLGLSPDGRTLTAYSSNVAFQLPSFDYYVWDFTRGRVLSHRPDTSGFAPNIFSADGQVAAGDVSGPMIEDNVKDKPRPPQPKAAKPIGIINVVTGRQLLTLPQPDQSSQAIAFSPDAQTLLTETSEEFWEGDKQHIGKHFIHLWELRSGKERLTIPSEKSGWEFDYQRIVFSSDGRKLATARADRTIQVWDVRTGKELLRHSGYDAYVTCLTISPDGKTLASGHNDSTILVWDMPEASRPRAAKAAANPKALEAWWTDLAGSDARKAHIAIWELGDRPQQAVPLLRDRLKPASALPPEQFRQLLRDLDSMDFKTREAASKKLATFSDDVEPTLQEALKVSKSAEQRRRIEDLLAAPRIVPPGDKLRHLRAVEVLEHIGAPESLQILQGLAKGAPEARLTQGAKASLERLGQQAVSLP